MFAEKAKEREKAWSTECAWHRHGLQAHSFRHRQQNWAPVIDDDRGGAYRTHPRTTMSVKKMVLYSREKVQSGGELLFNARGTCGRDEKYRNEPPAPSPQF